MSLVVEANADLSTNTVPRWMWLIIDFLVTSCGWTQYGSGDGATYANGSAGPVTSGAAGATGLGDAGSWVRLRKVIAGLTMELMFYSGGSGSGSALVSLNAPFSGGSPSATQRPESTDEQFFPYFGSGTAASPSHASPCTGNPAWMQLSYDTVTNAVRCFSYDDGSKNNNHCFFIEPLKNTLVTRGCPFMFGSGDYTNTTYMTSSLWATYRQFGSGGASWEVASINAAIHAVGNDPDEITSLRQFDMQFYSPGLGCYGDADGMQWASSSQGNATLNTVTTTGDYIVAGAAVMPWNNTAVV